jgi:hypothetical protein
VTYNLDLIKISGKTTEVKKTKLSLKKTAVPVLNLNLTGGEPADIKRYQK